MRVKRRKKQDKSESPLSARLLNSVQKLGKLGPETESKGAVFRQILNLPNQVFSSVDKSEKYFLPISALSHTFPLCHHIMGPSPPTFVHSLVIVR